MKILKQLAIITLLVAGQSFAAQEKATRAPVDVVKRKNKKREHQQSFKENLKRTGQVSKKNAKYNTQNIKTSIKKMY